MNQQYEKGVRKVNLKSETLQEPIIFKMFGGEKGERVLGGLLFGQRNLWAGGGLFLI